MKKYYLVLVLALISSYSFSQISFSVSPGSVFNGGTVGYKIGKFNPYFGIQYAGFSSEYSEKGKRFNYDLNKVEDYSKVYSTKLSVYMPSVGLKFFFSENKKIRPYINVQYFKPVVKLKLKTPDDVADEINEYEKQINDISMWAVQGGFGVEYFFDDNFSIGGELGLRDFKFNLKKEEKRTLYDGNTGQSVEYTRVSNMDFGFSNVYSKVSINYYF